MSKDVGNEKDQGREKEEQKPEGRLKPCGELRLLHTNEILYIPVTQVGYIAASDFDREHDAMNMKTNLSKWGYADTADTACECGTSEQTMQHLLRCPLLENECSLEDLATANKKALHCARAWPNI